MSENASPTATTGSSVSLETGIEALQSSQEFRGPTEPLEDHPHANDHFALIYDSQAEQFAAAIPFIRQGLERDERCLYITYENSREEVEAAMRDHGIDVDAALESGKLSIHDEQETYLRNETFDADETVEFIDAAIEEATEEYEALRMTGEMSSVLQEDPECEELVKCEAKANYLFDEVDGLALCQYNRNRFPAEVIRDVIKTHPLLIHDGRVSHNVHYTPPDEFFGPGKAEHEVDRLLGSLRDQTDVKAELHQRERFLREGYQITADPTRDFEEKIHQLLDLARERTNLDVAGLTHLSDWDGKFRIEYALGFGDDDGVVTASDGMWTDPSDGCFCRQAVDADEPVGMTDVRGTEWEADKIHQEHGLTSYLGTKVTSGSSPYGTLWVGSTEPRGREFSETERTFLELIGQWVSNELERREHNDAQQELYDITADPDRSFEEKLDALLDLGCQQFDLDLGGLAKVDPGTDYFEVECVNDEHDYLVPGAQADLSETYCQVATDRGSEDTLTDPVAVTDPVDDGFEGKLCYEQFGVRAYLGSYLTFEEADNRTFWFVSNTPRDEGFSEAERTFFDLMGQWVKYELERRQRERELERALDLLEKTESIADVGGWEIDMETQDVFWTDHIFELLEISGDEEPPLEKALDLYHEEDQPIVEDAIENAIASGNPFDVEVRIRTASSQMRWLRLQGVPETVGNEVVSLRGAAQDVTDRKQREAEIRQTKNRFETVFKQSNDSIFVLDPDKDKIVDANPEAAEMTGYTRDELLSLGPSDLHPDEIPQFQEFLTEVRETGSAWNEDLHCRHKDGRDLPAEVSASAIALDGRELVLANVRHIDERKTHERYQRELYDIVADSGASFDEKLERLLELGRERFGLENGYFNRIDADAHEFEVVTEVGPHNAIEPGVVDSLEGTYCETHLTASEPLAVADMGDAGLDDLRAHDQYELEAYFAATVHVGGDEYATLCFASETPRDKPFTEAERTFLDLMAQCISYELERNHREAQLEQKNNRLESFASLLAHELRNPVQIGQIYTQQLPDETDAEAVEYVTEAFDRIEDMVDVLLILTRGREAVADRSPVDLSAAARKAWETVDAPDAALDIELGQTIQADDTYVRHLFRNLLDNAVKHGGADVTVTVGQLRDGFYVADDGTGIPPAERDAVFDEGYTTAADNGGTGLGLAFVQKLAEVYEWDLAVTESEDGGARFEFRKIT